VTRRSWRSAVARILARNSEANDPILGAEAVARAFRTRHAVAGQLDLDVAARVFGAEIVRRGKGDAWLERSQSGYVIHVDGGAPRERQRYSIAHELGHIGIFNATGMADAFSHQGKHADDGEASEIESLCDAFASELLMPIEEWASATTRFGTSIPVLRRLARAYGVSRLAAARRMADASLWRTAIIVWRPASDLAEAVGFFRKRLYESDPWPTKLKISSILPEVSDVAAAKRTYQRSELPLQLGERILNTYAESGWLQGKEPLIATIILGEPHLRSLYRQFWSEDDLNMLSNDDVVRGRTELMRAESLF
jgi:hypothetical protein